MILLPAGLLLGVACSVAPVPPTAGPSGSVDAPAVVVPPEIAGRWSGSGEGPTPPDGGYAIGWRVDLEVVGDQYVRTGYPPWEERATVTRIEREGSEFRLYLTGHVQNGSPVPDGAVTLTRSDDGSLTVGTFRLHQAAPPVE